MLNDLAFSYKYNRFFQESDVQPFDDWTKNKDFTGISCHSNKFYIFITHEQAINHDEYLEGTTDPYWNKSNPGFKEAEKNISECTLELIEKIELRDDPSTRILDVACGKGNITDVIKKKYAATTIVGLDISITAIQQAVKNFDNIEFIVGDCFSMPFAPETFDLIICNNFWEHINNPHQLGHNIIRLLKPNGSLIISTPSRYNFENLWSILLGRKVNFQNPTFHVMEYSIGQVIEQLNRCGFEIQKIISKSAPLYGASWKKKLKYKLVKPLIQQIINFTNSHHILETTAFFLTKKNT